MSYNKTNIFSTKLEVSQVTIQIYFANASPGPYVTFFSLLRVLIDD